MNDARWLLRWSGSDAPPRQRLICFPHAGAGASAFYVWSRYLPPGVEMCAIQPPGRHTRASEASFDSIDELLPAVCDALEHLLDVPYVCFGHSLGALVGFEFARWVHRSGRPLPRHVFVSAMSAPQRPLNRRSVSELSDDEFVAAVLSLDGTDASLFADPEMRALMLPPLRADFRVHESYRFVPGPPLPTPLTALYGEQDPATTLAGLAGWGELAERFDTRGFPGRHFFAFEQSAAVLEVVLAALVSDSRRHPAP